MVRAKNKNARNQTRFSKSSDFFYKFKIYKYLIILLDIFILSGPYLDAL